MLDKFFNWHIPKPQNPKYNCINIKVKYKRKRTSGKSIFYFLTLSSDDLLNQPASGCRTSCDSVHMWCMSRRRPPPRDATPPSSWSTRHSDSLHLRTDVERNSFGPARPVIICLILSLISFLSFSFSTPATCWGAPCSTPWQHLGDPLASWSWS